MTGFNFGGLFGNNNEFDNADSYYSITPADFSSELPATEAIQIVQTSVKIVTNGIDIIAPVHLPDGAEIIEVRVYGDAAASDKTWYLRRIGRGAGPNNLICQSTVQALPTPVDNAYTHVNNLDWKYMITILNMATGDDVYGAYVLYSMRGQKNARN